MAADTAAAAAVAPTTAAPTTAAPEAAQDPDTNRLIPSSFNTEIEFSVPELLQAIERASLLSHEGRNNIVRLAISEEAVVLYGNSPEIWKVTYCEKAKAVVTIYWSQRLFWFGHFSEKHRFSRFPF